MAKARLSSVDAAPAEIVKLGKLWTDIPTTVARKAAGGCGGISHDHGKGQTELR